MYGWGWSYSSGKNADVPGPFSIEVVVDDMNGFKTAIGRVDDGKHPLTKMWIVLSPIQAINKWDLSHVCAFNEKPDIADELGKLIAAADVTGFARAFIDAESPQKRPAGS